MHSVLKYLCAVLLCPIFCMAANFNLKKFSIPDSKATIDIPVELNICAKTQDRILLCTPDMSSSLLIIKYKNKTSKNIYTDNVAKAKSNNLHIFGYRKIKNVYWLDYGSNQSRFFTIATELEPNLALQISYSLIGQNMTGYNLIRYQKSLQSLKME